MGVSTPVVAILRDMRLRRFRDQVIAIFESNIHDGPSFFNCYPDYSIDLINPPIKIALVLNIGTPGTIADPSVTHISVIDRIHYKVSKIYYNFKDLKSFLKNKIVVLERNLRKFGNYFKKLKTRKLGREQQLQENDENDKLAPTYTKGKGRKDKNKRANVFSSFIFIFSNSLPVATNY